MPGLREMGDHTPFMRLQSAHCSALLRSSPYVPVAPVITGGRFLGLPVRAGGSTAAQWGQWSVSWSCVVQLRGAPWRLSNSAHFLLDAQYDELFTLEIRIRIRVGGRAVINR